MAKVAENCDYNIGPPDSWSYHDMEMALAPMMDPLSFLVTFK
jgi:hypothetical protein